MVEKVFVLEGHPAEASYCAALAASARDGAENAGAQVRHLRLAEMDFDIDLKGIDPEKMPLEPDLQAVWDAFVWCDRVIIVHPLWWGSAPAKLKGLFDRVLRAGFAYEYKPGKSVQDGLLKGRQANVLVTSDTPGWFFRLVYKSAWRVILRKQILEFCGLKTGRIENVGPVRSMTDTQRKSHLDGAFEIGKKFRR